MSLEGRPPRIAKAPLCSPHVGAVPGQALGRVQELVLFLRTPPAQETALHTSAKFPLASAKQHTHTDTDTDTHTQRHTHTETHTETETETKTETETETQTQTPTPTPHQTTSHHITPHTHTHVHMFFAYIDASHTISRLAHLWAQLLSSTGPDLLSSQK